MEQDFDDFADFTDFIFFQFWGVGEAKADNSSGFCLTQDFDDFADFIFLTLGVGISNEIPALSLPIPEKSQKDKISKIIKILSQTKSAQKKSRCRKHRDQNDFISLLFTF